MESGLNKMECSVFGQNLQTEEKVKTEEEVIQKSKASIQISRLQKELQSMRRSAGYTSDYLIRKFKGEYEDIMIINHGDDCE